MVHLGSHFSYLDCLFDLNRFISSQLHNCLALDKDAYTNFPDTSNDDVRRNQDPVENRREPVAPRRFEQREITRRHSDDLVTDEGASSTLFVGNLSGNVRYKDLMSLFKRYGDIEASRYLVTPSILLAYKLSF